MRLGLKRLESFDLDAADVARIDEILKLQFGEGLAAEAARWKQRRWRHWLAVSIGVLVLSIVAVSWYLRQI